MVYGGRPSRGCETCRQRRIKCDERKPSCAQCEKSKRFCRGYRDVLNLLFRSENEGVEKRVRRTQPEQVHYLLPQEPEQLALNYFFNNYVLIPRRSDAAHGYMEVLPVLYANLAPNSPLLSATSALAFAAFGKDALGRQFFPNTRLKYGEAIARLNEALGDPVAVRKDETLMAVLIMGMVEIATSVATSFWNTHTDGAAAIIRLRGREIFASETSTRLFHHTRIQMALRQIEEPAVLEKTDREVFMEMMESEFSLHDEQSVTDTLTRLMLRLPKIRMLADNLFRETRSESTTQAMLQLIECCQHLDNALSTWREATPEDWQYTSQPNSLSILADLEPETPKVYPSTVDVYPDVWTVKAWNSYRTTRIIVQAIILRSVAWLAADGIQDVRVIQQMAAALQARQIIQEMVDEICASVPFHLGQVTIQSLESVSTFGNRPRAKVLKSVEDPTIEHLGGYFLLRPLYIARSTRIIPNEQKMWIGVQLLNIATSLGLDEEPIFTKLSEHPAQGLFGLEGSWAP